MKHILSHCLLILLLIIIFLGWLPPNISFNFDFGGPLSIISIGLAIIALLLSFGGSDVFGKLFYHLDLVVTSHLFKKNNIRDYFRSLRFVFDCTELELEWMEFWILRNYCSKYDLAPNWSKMYFNGNEILSHVKYVLDEDPSYELGVALDLCKKGFLIKQREKNSTAFLISRKTAFLIDSSKIYLAHHPKMIHITCVMPLL